MYIQASNWKKLYLHHVKTYLTHTWKNDTLKKIDLVKHYLHLQKPTFNILLQCIIWNMMHNSEKINKNWLVNWKHQMYYHFMLGFIVIFYLLNSIKKMFIYFILLWPIFSLVLHQSNQFFDNYVDIKYSI